MRYSEPNGDESISRLGSDSRPAAGVCHRPDGITRSSVHAFPPLGGILPRLSMVAVRRRVVGVAMSGPSADVRERDNDGYREEQPSRAAGTHTREGIRRSRRLSSQQARRAPDLCPGYWRNLAGDCGTARYAFSP